MSSTFCTIITSDYLHYAYALCNSIKVFDSNTLLHVLIANEETQLSAPIHLNENIRFHFIEEVTQVGWGLKIKEKYYPEQIHEFRWSMKPVFLLYLLQQGYDKVVCCDGDLFFFNSPFFLFDKLNTSNILLTPHWRASNPHVDIANFKVLLTSGLFNAGFIAANQLGIPALEWWAMVCDHTCIIDTTQGFFMDQGFLNLMPIYFPNIEILQHKGCNIANWNQLECKREIIDNGEVMINGDTPIIFIHFTKSTIRGIINGEDGNLMPHLQKYSKALNDYKPSMQLIEEHKALILADKNKQYPVVLPEKSFMQKIRDKIQLRTRLKNMFR